MAPTDVVAPGYRQSAKVEAEWSRASDAFYDLLDADKALRRKLRVFTVVAMALGFACAIALLVFRHQLLWFSGRAVVLAIALAFAAPSVPVLALGRLTYWIKRRRLVARWLEESSTKYRLPRHVLEERAAGLP